MSTRRLPLFNPTVRVGTGDRFFDALHLVGPIVIVLIALFGRTPVTVSLAAGYIGVFVAYTVLNFLR